MSDEKHESAPPKSGRRIQESARGAGGKRPSAFTIATMIVGAIAMSLIVWRISKAWRIEYGGGPREPRPIPTTGAWGAPGALGRPPASASSGQ